MRLLLDTHILLWAMSDNVKLSKAARRQIANADTIFASAASLWEISVKVALAKLHLDIDELVTLLGEAGLEPLPISFRHARLICELPRHHRDPFDHMLIAQAISEPLHLLTHDATLARYSELVVVV